jgi:hypothetical protein
MKRVLFDTGSDMNLISAPTHADLKSPIRPLSYQIHSVAGQSCVVGETDLKWAFLDSKISAEGENSTYSDTFFVLSTKELTLFDCILGRHWIDEHRSLFWRLWTGQPHISG